MTSNDNRQLVTVEMFNSAMDKIDKHFDIIDGKIEVTREEIHAVKELALINSAKIDAYKDFTSLWFSGIAILVALIGFIGTLAPMFRDMYKETKQERKDKSETLSREDIQTMIDSTVEQAIAKVLGSLGK